MNTGERIKKRRTELRITQDELADKIGYKSRVSVAQVENGRAISQKVAKKYAEALKVPVAYIMCLTDDNGLDIQTQKLKLTTNSTRLTLEWLAYV